MLKRNAFLLLLSGSVAAATALATSATQAAEPFRLSVAAPAGQAAPPAPQAPIDLRRMSGSLSDLFLSGEFAARTIPFFARPEEASGKARMVLALQTAISVAPEQSHLTVRINGKDVGATGLRSGEQNRISFDVPENVIQPGYNAVELAVDQRHRVDCSIDATYELWTKIDPQMSGFQFQNVNQAPAGLIDLMTAAGTENGRTAIRVVLPDGSQMGDYDRALRAVQAISLLGKFAQPSVEFASTPGTGPGVEIYFNLSGNGRLPEGTSFSRKGPMDRVAVTITASDRTGLDRQIDDLVTQTATQQVVGTPDGLAALENQNGRLLEPHQKITLGDMGFVSKRFAGRHVVSDVAFTMPSDFYPGDYASMILHLSALYGGGLSPDAVLVVKANGKQVSNISLAAARNGAIRDQRLPIPFSALRPGRNVLQIEARLPANIDKTCDTVDKASDGVRLAISDKSYLEVPNYARVGRYPDIAGLTSGLTADHVAGIGSLPQLFVPDYDKSGINAAATFVAKMAVSSDKVKPFHFTSVMPQGNSAQVIAFGDFQSLPRQLTDRMRIDLVNMRQSEMHARLNPAGLEVASLDMPRTPGSVQTDGTDNTLMSFALIGASTLSERASNFANSPVNQSLSLLDDVRGNLSDTIDTMKAKAIGLVVGDSPEKQTFAPAADSEFFVAQADMKSDGLWTVIASRKHDGLATDMDVLTSNAVWSTLGGAAQSFTETGHVIDQTTSSSETLFRTQPMTISNARLVAAGWLANNSRVYVGGLLIVAILLGFSTFLVLMTGRRRKA